MSLHTVIQELRSTETQAESKIQKAEGMAEHSLHAAAKRADEDFNALKIRLQSERDRVLKSAENEVAKETEQIISGGKNELKKLTEAAKSKKQAIKAAITKTLFP